MPAATPPNLSFPDLTASVGQRIRALRSQRGISLSALAAGTRLGKGTLSELERGQRNPTLDTLFAIATTLSVPLSDLLGASPQGTGVGEEARPTAHGQNIDAELLGRWEDGPEILEVYRMSVGAGRRQSRPHAAGVIESITVISGTVVVGTLDAPVRLSSGQSHTFRGDTDHVYEGFAEHSSTVLVMRYPI